MKRYVLLILAILLFMIVRISWLNARLQRGIDEMRWQIDSLEMEVNLVLETESKDVKNEITIPDSLILQFKGNDSAIFSHGQQIRWLQWHVERLNQLK